ncbi:MAG: bifunctional phosphopantothenoylcysteine decarboxylase/phosphopantothenate--cysteine ligase CoaBC [Christensenellaceae bacterium]|nr:bifunctional phosphopantothenoylcysteine decarboxylase/phosphopantothenate--cysteine ligase CoaBC [Christensenellaceae bacterium]
MKTIILCVSGGIAAYKACYLTSLFKKNGFEVRVILTENAKEFVSALTFERLSNYKVVSGTFEKSAEFEVEHVSYAKAAAAYVIAPATANVIAKLANGVCDDFLTTTVAAKCKGTPVFVCPAMNTEMYDNEANLLNLETLKARGYGILDGENGRLACGDYGKGRMAEPEDIYAAVIAKIAPKRDMAGKTVLVTAGGTQEPIDGVRFITNRSSGKMGVAIAQNALDRGAKVIFIHGFISVCAPKDSTNIAVSTTLEMYNAVTENLNAADIVIKAAAPSDYRVENYSRSKIKGDKITLNLIKNPDIAASVGKVKGDKKLVVFAAETDNLIENAKVKLVSKNADLVVANDVLQEGAGFNGDTNIASFVEKSGKVEPLPLMSKSELAEKILDKVISL